MTSRPRVAACALLFTLLVAAGCSNLGGTGDKGYIDGSGSITKLAVSDRHKPGNVSGETLDGANVELSQYLGHVVVINVWGSWCPPCRSEADDLATAAKQLQTHGVVFLGINTRDASRDNALAFQRERKTPYASIFDPGGRNLLAFRGTLTPASIPSTVIIDAQGRVAASILGEVTSPTTLIDLVEDVQK